MTTQEDAVETLQVFVEAIFSVFEPEVTTPGVMMATEYSRFSSSSILPAEDCNGIRRPLLFRADSPSVVALCE